MGIGIEIRGLVVRRGQFVLRVPRLSISPGESFAVLGRTGSGKTVLMESIAGACEVSEGSIELDGTNVRELDPRDRRIGLLYQDCLLFPHLSVVDNVAYGPQRMGAGTHEARWHAQELLELLGVGHLADAHPNLLSGGEAQRVALARALATRPGMLVLDEPFSALDPTTRGDIRDAVRRVVRDFGCTLLFVTHDFSEAQEMSERVGIVLDGRLRTVVDSTLLLRTTHEDDVARFLGIQP
ncbi:ABC transporter ATP-binding protein [Olsenella phocaeensis]|uniref:ABC transporter ATP-binding protein n=1 Tax=Olsenella phocaeensis TaxID=1852385 RepID=UPI000931B177|nr:ATP-binding cassette domain-containing protein [Olsenella phocaeensis]